MGAITTSPSVLHWYSKRFESPTHWPGTQHATTACSQFYMSLLEAVYISRKKLICAGKSSPYSLYNCFGKIKACCHYIDCVSPYYCAISLKSISPYCRVHFSLLQNAFLLTADCISSYCIWFLEDPAHHIPNQTEIATDEFCPKSSLQKQNEIGFIKSQFQILHHLKTVHKLACLMIHQLFPAPLLVL